MIIEKLKKEEINLYKELIDEAFDGSNDISSYEAYDENESSYEIIVAKDEESGKMIGSITMYKLKLFTFSFQPTIELFNVCTAASHMRKGVGRKLIEYCIEYAKANGFKTIHFTCLEDEKDVHAFYESCGFKKAESRKYNMYL